jgi:hypothetical protein
MADPQPQPKSAQPPSWWSLLRDLAQRNRALGDVQLPPGEPGAFSISDLFRGATGLGEQGPAGPTWTNAGALLAAIPVGGLKSLKALATGEKAAEEATAGIRAYHGSPHEFEKFSMEKIGSGEGAQAYGHGLYFAEQEGTAKSYRDQLSQFGHASEMPEEMSKSILLDNKVVSGATPSNQLTPLERAALSKHYAGGIQAHAIRDVEDSLKYLTPGTPAHQLEQETLDALKSTDLTGRVKPFEGRMYEVNIKADPAHFLDWDAPLSQQSEAIQKLFPVQADGRVHLPNGERVTPERLRGETLYRALSESGLGPEGASAKLTEAGIPGIKYLDQGSRASAGGELIDVSKTAEGWRAKIRVGNRSVGFQNAPTTAWTISTPYKTEAEARAWAAQKIGGGTYNYSVTNDQLIDILRKYGWLPPVAGLGYLSQVGQPQTEAR